MAEQSSSLLAIIALIVGLIPGAYFVWLVVKGLILTLRQGKDEDL
jgi:hypothetical protein